MSATPRSFPRVATRRSALLAMTAAMLVSLALPAPADAQRRRRARLDQDLMKNAPVLLQAVEGVADDAAESTVRILVGEEAVALGTIVTPDGYLLTKASELEGDFKVELPDGTLVAGRVVGVLREHDLAAVKVEASGLTPARFSADGVNESSFGQWLCSPAPRDEGILAVGNLSVQGLRRIPGSGSLLGVRPGRTLAGIPVYRVDPGGAADRAGLQPGDLITELDGVPVEKMRDLVRILRNGPPDARYTLTITREGERERIPLHLTNGQAGVTLTTEATGVPIDAVTAGSGAEAAGIRQGDIVIAIDDRPVQTPEALVRLIQSRSPGDVVEVTLLREGEEQILDATLGYHSGRSIRGDFQNQLGSELSSRAVDFPAVLQHDSILNGHQMGGPIVDLKGRILGINIARAGRVETYALPAQVLEQAIPALLSGKLPTATGPALTEEGKPPVQTEPGRE